MSSIMRGDQTVALIQQYHANYPEIARNTQDVEGRKQRVQMWAQITDELNARFGTNFTVEQFKKKVQNVQCTSRQKLQSGKRNLGDAESEYVRLFEQGRFNADTPTMKFENFADEEFLLASGRAASESRNNGNTLDASAKVKMDQMLQQVEKSLSLAHHVLPSTNGDNPSTSENGDVEEDDLARAHSILNGSSSFLTTTNSNNSSLIGNILGANNSSTSANALFNTSALQNGNSSANGLEQAQQFLLALVANATSNSGNSNGLTLNGKEDDSLGGSGGNLLAGIQQTARCRKRTFNNNNNNTNLLNNNTIGVMRSGGNGGALVDDGKRLKNENINNNGAAESNRNNNSSNINNNGLGLTANGGTSYGVAAKRRRKQAHALHLSNLRAAAIADQPQLDDGGEENGEGPEGSFSGFASDSAASGWDASQSLFVNGGNVAISSVGGDVADTKWKQEILESVVENQRRILDIMENQLTMRGSDRLPKTRHPSASSDSGRCTSQSPPFKTSAPTVSKRGDALPTITETALSTLCTKIDRLAGALTVIERTMRRYLPTILRASSDDVVADGDAETEAGEDFDDSREPRLMNAENNNNDCSNVPECGDAENDNGEAEEESKSKNDKENIVGETAEKHQRVVNGRKNLKTALPEVATLEAESAET